jgi:hypothetical protein
MAKFSLTQRAPLVFDSRLSNAILVLRGESWTLRLQQPVPLEVELAQIDPALNESLSGLLVRALDAAGYDVEPVEEDPDLAAVVEPKA